MSEAIFHEYWRSSAAYRVRIVLNLKGVAYRSSHLDLTQGENQREDTIRSTRKDWCRRWRSTATF